MTLVPMVNPSMIFDFRENFEKNWCVYDHSIFNDVTQTYDVIYIGCCKLLVVFNFLDAHRNSKWRELVTPRTVLNIRILLMGTRQECNNERGRLLMTSQPRPICNAVGYDFMGMTTAIICNEDGRKWPNQKLCAETLGINQGQLSQHLAGKPGFNRVAGFTFRRGE